MGKVKEVITPNSFSEAISMFLDKPSESGTKKRDYPSTYEKKIEIFKMHLYKENELWKKGTYWMNLAKKINLDDIKESMRFYVEHSRLTTKKVHKQVNLKTYFSVISSFLKFLHKDLKLENVDLFVKLGAHDNYPPEISKLILDVSLEKGLIVNKDGAPILEEEEYKEIAINCYNFWQRYKGDPFAKKYKYNRYKMLIARLLIQLYLHTGLSSEKIPKIKIGDIATDCTVLRIEDYEMYLPEKISLQLNDYLIFREHILSEIGIKTDQLFISDKGNSSFNSHSLGKPDLVNHVIKTSLATHSTSSYFSLIKYAIIKMINQNINIDSIERLTGHGITIIRSCYDYIYELDKEKEKMYVNSKSMLISQKYKF